eukprot:4568965-Pleurochrysis_carterae.AAC.6
MASTKQTRFVHAKCLSDAYYYARPSSATCLSLWSCAGTCDLLAAEELWRRRELQRYSGGPPSRMWQMPCIAALARFLWTGLTTPVAYFDP